MMASKEQLAMDAWQIDFERRLTAVEAKHRAIGRQVRNLADSLTYPVSSLRETRIRLRELADLLEGRVDAS